MTAFERFVCSRYQLGQLTLAQVDALKAQGKISQAAYDCILNPECSCEWTALAAQADGPEEAA